MRKLSHFIIVICLLVNLWPSARVASAQTSACVSYSFSDAALPNFTYVFGSRVLNSEWQGLLSSPDEGIGYQTIAFGTSDFQTVEKVAFSIQGAQFGDTMTFQALSNTGSWSAQFNNRTNVNLFISIPSPIDSVLFSIRATNGTGTPGQFFTDGIMICGVKKSPPTRTPTPSPAATATPAPSPTSIFATATPGPSPTPEVRPQGNMPWIDPVLQQPTGPAICTGWLYYNLKSTLNAVLYPLFYFGQATQGWNSTPAKKVANDILSPIASFMGYIAFFNDLTPAFRALPAMLFLYLLILSIKASLSLIKWLKQILPWLG